LSYVDSVPFRILPTIYVPIQMEIEFTRKTDGNTTLIFFNTSPYSFENLYMSPLFSLTTMADSVGGSFYGNEATYRR